jgi:hypothetical protein
MHDQAGPLHPSPAMLELIRLARALGGSFGEATLDVAAVHSIEAALGVTLPDDVLVVLAAREPNLLCATGLSLHGMPGCAREWSEGVPESHVAIADLYDEPFAAEGTDWHGGPREVIAVARSGERSSPDVLVVYDGAPSERTTLGAFAREKLADWFGQRDGWRGVLLREAALPLEDASFRPALVGVVPAPPAPRFVVHPRFGRGRVVEERAGGAETKLVVDFETAGRKTVVARSVTDA